MILHMSTMPEVRCAIQLMEFVKCYPELFKGNESLAFSITFMKLTGVIMTELANIFIIIKSQSIEGVVKDFVALFIIADIDNIMLLTV